MLLIGVTNGFAFENCMIQKLHGQLLLSHAVNGLTREILLLSAIAYTSGFCASVHVHDLCEMY